MAGVAPPVLTAGKAGSWTGTARSTGESTTSVPGGQEPQGPPSLSLSLSSQAARTEHSQDCRMKAGREAGGEAGGEADRMANV